MKKKYLNPSNYFKKIADFFFGLSYNPKKEQFNLEKEFERANLSYSEGIHKLKDLGINNVHFSPSMASIHWVLFAAISNKFNCKNILEIGTYNGETTLILQKLFPNSNILTIDLPSDDPIIKSYLGEKSGGNLKDHLKIRDENLNKCSNVTFIETNSFFLPDHTDKIFDLIWVDGGHLYPEIAWDVCNSYHLCKQGGLLLYDDIIPNASGYRNGFTSPDSHNVIKYLSNRISSPIFYFLKRNNTSWSANPKKRKYVAMMVKNEDLTQRF